MRTLNWKYHLGLVSLDVELADRTLSLSVSPVHAAIILHFQNKSECCGSPLCASMGGKATFHEQLEALAGGPRPGAWVWISNRIFCTPLLIPGSASLAFPGLGVGSVLFSTSSLISMVCAGTWTLTELSEVLKVPVTSLKRKMTLWLQQGVLREEPEGTFTVIEEEQKDQVEKVVLIDSDEEGDSAMASQADQKEEELQVPVSVVMQTSCILGLGNLIQVMDSICAMDSHFPLQVAESSTNI